MADVVTSWDQPSQPAGTDASVSYAPRVTAWDAPKPDDATGAYRPSPEAARKAAGVNPAGGNDKSAEIAGSLLNAGYNLGGAVTDTAAKVLPPEGAAAVGTAANFGTELATAFGPGAAGKIAKFPELAKTLMQSSIKPVLSQISTGKAARAIQTLLDEGIPATKGGVEKLRSMIGELEQEVTQKIASSTGTVDKTEVLQRLKPLLEKFRNQATPNADLATIRGAAKEFFEHPLFPKKVPEQQVQSTILNERGQPFTKTIPASGTDQIPVQTAQAVKEGTYRALGDKAYGAGLKPAAERDALKSLARGLKEEIEKVVPDVAAPNAKQSELINAIKVLARRTGMEANKNPLGLGWLVRYPEAAIGFLAERSPWLKSRLAIGLHSGGFGEGVGRTAGTGVGMYSGSEPENPGVFP